jgi:hypothetical protein
MALDWRQMVVPGHGFCPVIPCLLHMLWRIEGTFAVRRTWLSVMGKACDRLGARSGMVMAA